jgi:hypothetical protein
LVLRLLQSRLQGVVQSPVACACDDQTCQRRVAGRRRGAQRANYRPVGSGMAPNNFNPGPRWLIVRGGRDSTQVGQSREIQRL